MNPENLFIGAKILDPSGFPFTVTFDFFKTASKQFIEQCNDIPLDEEMVSNMSFEGQYEVEVKPFSKLKSSNRVTFSMSYHGVTIATGLTKLTELQLICKALFITLKIAN
jgi:hypothetical protein